MQLNFNDIEHLKSINLEETMEDEVDLGQGNGFYVKLSGLVKQYL